METAKNDKNEIMVNCVNKKLVAAIKKLKMEIQRRMNTNASCRRLHSQAQRHSFLQSSSRTQKETHRRSCK